MVAPICMGLAACDAEIRDQDDTPETATAGYSVVENTEDWDWIGLHTRAGDPAFNRFPAGDPRNSVTAANAIVSLNGCTGSLVGRDVIMTADHCYRTASGSLPVPFTDTATFFFDTASPRSFTCTGPLQSDTEADLITLRCEPDPVTGELPGDLVQPIHVSHTAPVNGADLFEFAVNCRCDDWSTGCNTWGVPGTPYQRAGGGSCTGDPSGHGNLYRLLSPGGTGQTHASRFTNCEVNNASASWTNQSTSRRGFNNNCDSLKGSSGGPIFDRVTGTVVGICSQESHTGGSFNSSGEAWNTMTYWDRDADGVLDINEARHKFRWVRFTSEELPERTCPTGHAVSGFECRGSNCDEVRVLCQPVPGGTGASRWSGTFSEESPGWHGCSGNEVVTGIRCFNGNCDDVELRCSDTTATVDNCTTGAWRSEEDGLYADLGNRFFRRGECRGSYCDDLRFEICRVNLPETCHASCGLNSVSGSCWCDEACVGVGDCCADFDLMCN